MGQFDGKALTGLTRHENTDTGGCKSPRQWLGWWHVCDQHVYFVQGTRLYKRASIELTSIAKKNDFIRMLDIRSFDLCIFWRRVKAPVDC